MISADLVPAWCVRFMCPLVLIDLATTRRSMGWVETSSHSSFLTRRTNIGKPGSSHQIRRHRPCNGTGPAAEKKWRGESHKRGGEAGYTVVVLERCVVEGPEQGTAGAVDQLSRNALTPGSPASSLSTINHVGGHVGRRSAPLESSSIYERLGGSLLRLLSSSLVLKVRFSPDSDHIADIAEGPRCSITSSAVASGVVTRAKPSDSCRPHTKAEVLSISQ